jgi:hypothetical protein
MHAEDATHNATRDSTNILTEFTSECNVTSMLRLKDFVKAFEVQIDDDTVALEKNRKSQAELIAAVVRYRKLQREEEQIEDRIRRNASLVDTSKLQRFNASDKEAAGNAVAVRIDSEAPLWLSIYAILEQDSPLQVKDIEDVLEYCGRKSTRQAIDSALNAHKEFFRIEMGKNREKFVSLKR